MLTRYESYSNEELLSMVEDKRQHSVIIDELCNRLEKAEPQSGEGSVNCPVCEAALTAYIEDDGFSLEVK